MCMLFPLADLRTLCETYIDAKMQAMEMHDQACAAPRVQDVCNTAPSLPYHLLSVALPKKQGCVFAKVSPEDFDRVNAASDRWRLSSAGYPLFVQRKEGRFVTTYLHLLVSEGVPVTHVNGDRLDCTRTNLVITKGRKKKRVDDSKDLIVRMNEFGEVVLPPALDIAASREES